MNKLAILIRTLLVGRKFRQVDGDHNKLKFQHYGIGCVIDSEACIHKTAKIYHNVTIGKKRGYAPRIERGVVIYPHSIIVGNVIIGENSIIGAGSFVDKEIPPNSIVHNKRSLVIRKRLPKQ